MQIGEILCKETGKTISADQIFKVKSKDGACIEEIVSYCFMCPYSEHGKNINPTCKNCYGGIVQSRKRFRANTRGNNTIMIENYRNTFQVDELGEYIRNLDADEFMAFIEKVANLKSLYWDHNKTIYDKLRAYDKPKTWKTDCTECMASNRNPECKLAKEYLEDKFGISIELMSEKQLTSEIPEEFICKNQAQTLYFV